jgi:acetolactate synthase I/II/III large subunit
MNGADRLCDLLLVNDVDVCFANPGTSEMHFVAALDRKPRMRCVLGLSEGVVTGAADGFGRMADKPAATLLHLGPGLSNGLANLHNARRARTPMLNVVGDHASYHLEHDAPLTSDIESLARPMSHWVGRVTDAADVRPRTEEALRAALEARGVATLILPADAAWSEVPAETLAAIAPPPRPVIPDAAIGEAVELIRKSRRAALFLGGGAMREEALTFAGRIAAATGAAVYTERAARWERGAGRVSPKPVPYNIDLAVEQLNEVDAAILIGGRVPVGFFAYPNKPGVLLPEKCPVLELARQEHDLLAVLQALAEGLGAAGFAPALVKPYAAGELTPSHGLLTPDAISVSVARHLPEGAIICEESITSSGRLAALAATMAPHDHLPLTGGAIGAGIPLAVGAAIACPQRKVVALQADGSGMYTLQGLWTQARERLDVLTVVFSNCGYSILKNEMRNVGVNDFGENARRMLDIDDPALDWCALACGMGVEAVRTESAEHFDQIFSAAISRKGPFLIEAIL